MNIIRKTFLKMALKAAAYASGGGSYSVQDPAFGTLLSRLMGNTTWAGKQVTDENTLGIPTAWACVRIIGETLGSLSWDVYEKQKANGNMVRVEHDLSTVLTVSPNANMDSMALRESLGTCLALRGNGYNLIGRSGKTITSLYPVPVMIPLQNRETGIISYKYNDRGKWEEVPQEDVWHVRGFGDNGLVGFSPLSFARNSFAISLAQQEFEGRFYSQGAMPRMVATIPQWLEPNQREKAKKALEEKWGGLENAHKLQLLEGGIAVEPLTMPFDDQQFVENKQLTREQVCAIFRMPPHLVGDLSRSTNNNIEKQSLEFIMFTLQPYISRIESAASKWLFGTDERARFFLRFNVDALLRADAAARATLHSQYVQNGIMTRNEVRAIEKLNITDSPGMDSYTVQSNLVPLDKLDAIAAKASRPDPTPLPPTPIKAGDTHIALTVAAPEVKVDMKAGDVKGGDVSSRTTT